MLMNNNASKKHNEGFRAPKNNKIIWSNFPMLQSIQAMRNYSS